MTTFNHFNFNVLDLEKSLKFYKDSLNLEPVREKVAEDGSFKLVYLGDGSSDFTLELTWLRDRTEPYNLKLFCRPIDQIAFIHRDGKAVSGNDLNTVGLLHPHLVIHGQS